jgi:ABC-type multidrug transport system ATPase subunit
VWGRLGQTFLFTLCGKATYGTQTGSLKINGQEAGVGDYRSSFGFVPQEDVMHRTMTVSEICHFSAAMR